MHESELRRVLEALTRRESDTAKHPELVAALPGHSIKHVPRSDARSPRFPEYNCFAFAFNLAESHKYRLIASRFTTIHADDTFADFLMKDGVLMEAPTPEAAAVVVYFEGALPTHAGKFSGQRVLSKWGIGELWEHGIREVPAQYGDVIKLYRNLPPEISEPAFIRFAQSRGVVRPERLPGWHAG